jgi:hypothetical protein
VVGDLLHSAGLVPIANDVGFAPSRHKLAPTMLFLFFGRPEKPSSHNFLHLDDHNFNTITKLPRSNNYTRCVKREHALRAVCASL